MAGRRGRRGPDPIDAHVGSRTRARRMGMRLSQGKLGDAIGVTFQQIQKYENGTNRIGASNLFRIANALGVDVAYFYEGLSDSPARNGLSDSKQVPFRGDPMSSREAIELMHNYFRITEEPVRKRLFQLIKSLSDQK